MSDESKVITEGKPMLENNLETDLFRPKLRLVVRDEWLVEKCAHQRVIHVGCTDAPDTRDKGRQNRLLHQKLGPVCRSLLGIDIARDGLEIMRKEFGIKNLHTGDAQRLDEVIGDREFDVILLPDVLEHLNNPGLFWESAHRCLSTNKGGRLVITVPMAFSVKRFGSLLLCRDEHPNYDHVAYYSPACMNRFAQRYGYSITERVSYLCL